MNIINKYCLSSYLTFRYVARNNEAWVPGVFPEIPVLEKGQQVGVSSSGEILSFLKMIVDTEAKRVKTGIFLSGGIDSAILAALLPPGTHAYTIDFIADSGANEAGYAKKYAEFCGLNLHVVNVSWEDYENYETSLMVKKKAPLHAVEVALYKAACMAREDGIESIFVGNGADSTFGGMDKLLSRDWKFDEFVDRYTFIDPQKVLRSPEDVSDVFLPYRKGEYIDYIAFLKEIHGLGIIQAFNNAVHSAGVSLVEPYEQLKLNGELDLQRIRNGEPKYLLVDVFKQLYPHITPPRKVPFARPMDEWLANYSGPCAEEFKPGLSMDSFSGDQKYLLHCLDKFIGLLREGVLCQ